MPRGVFEFLWDALQAEAHQCLHRAMALAAQDRESDPAPRASIMTQFKAAETASESVFAFVDRMVIERHAV